MATLIARAFGSIISAIAYCFFGYRDNKKSVSNINYYNMPKGRPLSLQVPFIPQSIFCFLIHLGILIVCLHLSPWFSISNLLRKKKLGLSIIHGHHIHDANFPSFPFYFMDYIYILHLCLFFPLRTSFMDVERAI